MRGKRVWIATGLALALVGTWSMPSYARNDVLMLSIADALKDPAFADWEPPSDVAFYWANQQPPKPGTSLGEVELKAKRAKIDGTDKYNCQLALMAVLNGFHKKAVAAGGNAVGNIVSYYRKNVFSSPTEYECHAGAIVAGVALKGTVVKLSK